jgi:hypothetical protein
VLAERAASRSADSLLQRINNKHNLQYTMRSTVTVTTITTTRSRRGLSGAKHRRFFAEFEFSNGRLSERARANERRLAAAKKARREILDIEAALSRFPNYSASSQRILERWAWRKAARSTLLQFYCVEQQQREQRHWAFSARRSALDRDMRLFQERFAIGTVPAVLAIGTWRPAPGHHFRGHRPGLSMRIRRRLARLPLTAVINVPEPYVSLAC